MRTAPFQQVQLRRLNRLLAELWERNPFYTRKWWQAGLKRQPLDSLEQLAQFPVTTRLELVTDQNAKPPLGTNLTYSTPTYERLHRSSGTTRAPLLWADTAPSWRRVLHCSRALYLMAGVTAADRVFLTLPFGRSSGPWIMYGGARALGCWCFAAGHADPEDQVRWIRQCRPSVLLGTPGQLHRVARAAAGLGVDTRKLGVERLISPGAVLDETREPLQSIWGTEIFDRYGLTEAGSVAGECTAHPGGMHLLEREFIAEVLRPDSLEPVPEGLPGELVLTNLGRLGRPIVRYRTGDLVRLIRQHHCPCGRPDALLVGGVRRRNPKRA